MHNRRSPTRCFVCSSSLVASQWPMLNGGCCSLAEAATAAPAAACLAVLAAPAAIPAIVADNCRKSALARTLLMAAHDGVGRTRRMTESIIEADIVVVGGGSAGSTAAIR